MVNRIKKKKKKPGKTLYGVYINATRSDTRARETTYIGFTTRPKHRLEVERGERKGHVPKRIRRIKANADWHMLALITGFKDRSQAQMFETKMTYAVQACKKHGRLQWLVDACTPPYVEWPSRALKPDSSKRIKLTGLEAMHVFWFANSRSGTRFDAQVAVAKSCSLGRETRHVVHHFDVTMDDVMEQYKQLCDSA